MNNISFSTNIRDINTEASKFSKGVLLNMFCGGDSVIMKRGSEVVRVMPPSNRNSSIIMGGTPNPGKAFADAIALFNSNEIADKIPIIDIGFSRENLTIIVDALKKSETIDFTQFNLKEQVTVHELLLTNVVFACPKHLLDECLKAYDEFDANVMAAFEFLWEHRTQLKNLIYDKKLETFPGYKSLGKNLQTYIFRDFVTCLKKENPDSDKRSMFDIIGTGPKSHWGQDAVDCYNGNAHQISLNAKKRGKEAQRSTNECWQSNAILAFVCNANVNCMYSLLIMPGLVQKTVDAFAKTAEKNRILDEKKVEKPKEKKKEKPLVFEKRDKKVPITPSSQNVWNKPPNPNGYSFDKATPPVVN